MAPLDPGSVEAFKGDASATKFLNTKEDLWKNTHKLSEFLGHANEYEAIFFVGGHGRMYPILQYTFPGLAPGWEKMID